MHSSQLAHSSDKDIKNFARNTTFANKELHAMRQPTRGRKQHTYA